MGRKSKKFWGKRPKNYPLDGQSFNVEGAGVSDKLLKDPAVIAEVESLFKKCFTYTSPQESFTLPSPSTWFSSEPWTDEILEDYKEKLNQVKASLSDFDINQWHEHTQFTNRAGQVIQHVKRSKKPELCTQAWAKFHEIVASFPILGQKNEDTDEAVASLDNLCSVHLCEAPGAFITSLNHYLQIRGFAGGWQWIANTLNPYYEGNSLSEMITDDRLIKETMDHWYFGRDNSGDLMSKDNVEGLMDQVSSLGTVDLVTCDGSIDCQNQPGDQETIVAPLHYSEVAAGLLILSPGGNLVIKMFTMLEPSSVCLMYLLNCMFGQVSVFKPATSKSGNSEVYVICLGMNTIDLDLRAGLIQLVGRSIPEQALFKHSDLPPEFLEDHQRCCQLFIKYQTQTIEENMALYKDMSSDVRKKIVSVRHQCAQSYVERFGLKTLSSQSYIVPPYQKVGNTKGPSQSIERRKPHTGSYLQRQDELNLPWCERILTLSMYDTQDSMGEWFENPMYGLLGEDVMTWPVQKGHVPKKIIFSLFCDNQMLQLYNSLLDHQETVNFNPDFKIVIDKLLHVDTVDITEDEEDTEKFIISLEDDPGSLVSEIAKRDEFHIKALGTDEGFRVFISDLGFQDAPNLNHQLLSSLLKMFQNIKEKESCVFVLPDVLTRFRGGILYVLYASFSKLFVSPLEGDAPSPLVLVCECFKCQEKGVITSWLNKVINCDSELKIVEFVPIIVLQEPVFNNIACDINEKLIKSRSNVMIAKQQNEITSS